MAGADVLPRQGVGTAAVKDVRIVVVLVDQEGGQKPLSRIRQRQCDRTGVQVEDRRGVDGVAVQPDDQLAVYGCRLAGVLELAECAVLHLARHIYVGFGPDEVVRRDQHFAVARSRPAARATQIRHGGRGFGGGWRGRLGTAAAGRC